MPSHSFNACYRTNHCVVSVTAAPWGAVAGGAAVWIAYPAFTPAFKHQILPFVFPDPEAKIQE